MTEGALIGMSVPISLSVFAIIELVVYEFEQDGALPSVSRELAMYIWLFPPNVCSCQPLYFLG
jgi:hypothetical protein